MKADGTLYGYLNDFRVPEEGPVPVDGDAGPAESCSPAGPRSQPDN